MGLPLNSSSAAAQAVSAESELEAYLSVRQQRRWIFPRAALVGLLAGAVAVLFRSVLMGADTVRLALTAWSHSVPTWGWMAPVFGSTCGAALTADLTRRFAPEAAGSGIPHLEAVLRRYRNLCWQRLLPVKFFGGVLAIGSGLVLGREGPTVQMGGATGAAVAHWLKVSETKRLTLITAGAGARLAAAFNARLAGLVFVLEEVRRDFQPIVFGAAFIACVIADVMPGLRSGRTQCSRFPHMQRHRWRHFLFLQCSDLPPACLEEPSTAGF
ncbi:MAG: chloride channel protein [Candidatus Binatia bacterium]|nr:chloride channel protein [Candidatus Binatia bacterium]